MRNSNKNVNDNKSYEIKTLYEYLGTFSNFQLYPLNYTKNDEFINEFLTKVFVIQESEFDETKNLMVLSDFEKNIGEKYDHSICLDTHLEIINYILNIFKKQKDNIGNNTTSSYNKNINLFLYNYTYMINDLQWFKIHQLIGSYEFFKLVVHYKIFYYCKQFQFLQISGNKNIENNYNNVVTHDGDIYEFQSNGTKRENVVSLKIFSLHYCLFKMVKNTKDSLKHLIPNKTTVQTMKDIFDMVIDTTIKSRDLQNKSLLIKGPITKRIETMNYEFYTNFKKIWTIVKQNHSHIQYLKILDSLCTKSLSLENKNDTESEKKNSHENNTINSVIEVEVVFKFITIIIEKLFPLKIWGNKHNKSIVFKNLNKLLRMDMNKNISIDQLLYGMKLSQIEWFNSLCRKTRDEKIRMYFEWFYLQFFPSLIKTFFYVTNISSKITKIVFYRQDVFTSIIEPYLNEYKEKYLKLATTCGNTKLTHDKSLLHTSARIVPKNLSKPNDFRIVAIPSPWIQFSNSIKFKWFVQDYIIPIRKILSLIRFKYLGNMEKYNGKKNKISYKFDDFDKISNLYEIPILIKNFKNAVGNSKPVYFVKFDIQSCYDSISVPLFMEKLKIWLNDKHILNENNGIWTIHKNSVALLNPELSMKQVTRKEFLINGINVDAGMNKIDNYAESLHGNNFQKSSFIKVHQRHNDILQFSNEDILYVVEKELYQTSIMIDGKCYLRKNGVFQGTFLSSVIMDLLYDDMLRTSPVFQNILKNKSNDHKSLIVRLADDFLILSTSFNIVESIAQNCITGFPEYNAYINADKLQFSQVRKQAENQPDEIIKFVGLTIDLKNLEITKDLDTFTNINYTFEPSVKKIYKKLLNLLEIRLKYNLINIQLNSNVLIIQHISLILSNMLSSFIEFVKSQKKFLKIDLHSDVSLKNFGKFITNVKKSLQYHLWKLNSYIFRQENSKLYKRKQFKKLKSLKFRYNALNSRIAQLIIQVTIAELRKANMENIFQKLITMLQQM